MSEATRIRAQIAGDKAIVRILMTHEMESGQRKDPLGKLIAPWFIQEVTVQLEGRPVLTAQWGPAMSRNPFLQCVLKGARVGDRITVSWVDNRGDRRTDDATVSA